VSGKVVPPTAQHATREATTCSVNIVAAIRGGNKALFTFEGLGTLGSLGHGSAVAQIMGVKVSGWLAWMLWRNIYLLKIPGIKSKVRIGIDWFIHLLFPPDLAQTRLEHESGIKNQHFEPGDIVFHEGDLGDSVYVIEKGECEVIKEEDGVARTVATLQSGSYFGEMALLSDLTRNATVRARTALDVLLIPKGDFDRLRKSVPAFGEVFRELAKKRLEEG
jgi:NADH dehydrogenase